MKGIFQHQMKKMKTFTNKKRNLMQLLTLKLKPFKKYCYSFLHFLGESLCLSEYLTVNDCVSQGYWPIVLDSNVWIYFKIEYVVLISYGDN